MAEQKLIDPELAKGWQFDEARRVIERFGGTEPSRPVLFETGYGPSGLPHIGTFGEVVRTTFIRRALEQLTGWQTRLVCFSDDMDGLRKVPDNVPNGDSLVPHLGLPLTKIPDPFGTHDSFGEHNNAQLRSFLDGFGFEYEFVSSSAEYASGKFNEGLLRLLENYDAVMEVMLPTLGEERQKTYSPILPLSPTSGHVLQVPIEITDKQRGLVRFTDEDGKQVETCILDGGAKLQWKPDWGMRWAMLEVDYEMSGKDLIPSAQLSTKICRILGSKPPCIFHYELFLDEEGGKISKSKGNGLSVEEWLRYAPASSLAWFMYGKPKAAKRLHFGVIPRIVEEWSDALAKWEEQDQAQRIRSPLWSVYGGETPPAEDCPSISYSLLLTLAATVGDPTEQVLAGFVARHGNFAESELRPMDKQLIGHALAYYKDFIKPYQKRQIPNAVEARAIKELIERFVDLPPDSDARTIQNMVYEVGKNHEFESLRDWFQACYKILFGQTEGPRLGSFFHLYGRGESFMLLCNAIKDVSFSNRLQELLDANWENSEPLHFRLLNRSLQETQPYPRLRSFSRNSLHKHYSYMYYLLNPSPQQYNFHLYTDKAFGLSPQRLNSDSYPNHLLGIPPQDPTSYLFLYNYNRRKLLAQYPDSYASTHLFSPSSQDSESYSQEFESQPQGFMKYVPFKNAFRNLSTKNR